MSRMSALSLSKVLRSNASDNAIAHFQAAAAVQADAFAGLIADEPFSGDFFSKSLLATAFPQDGVGDRLGNFAQPTALELAAAALVPDDIPSDDTTTRTLTVDGPRIISTINAPDDTDWFAVTLQAGVTYDFGQYATRFGPTGVPLRDAYIELRDANGNVLVVDDSGGPDSNTVDDALLTFTVETSGTYYIVARSWDTGQFGIDANPATTNGDYVGDYEVFARVSTLPLPYYEIHYETVDDPATERDEIGLPTLDSSPLHAIDWGTQFDGTSRNPDGQEGPRPTGNEAETKAGGKNIIYYYFAREGEVFVDNAANPLNLTTTIVAKGMAQWEKNAVELALGRYEQVADIDYVETEDRWAADIVVVTYNGTPGPGISLLGRMSPPDTPSEGQTEYNAADQRWTQEGLAPGGFYFSTLIHELGHGHGLSHPHDNGGRSSIMRGVEEESVANYTTGDFELNQAVFTMMSYEDGWQSSPYGQPSSTAGYGFIGSLMAFDIAVIQDKYGVNEEWATGNNVYVLEDENHKAEFDADGNLVREATSYKSIWDAGGTDAIVYAGAANANIDLRPATLKYEVGGGGWVSYAFGIHGGFTIANGVTIENAFSGSGNDTLTGNDAGNLLDGGAGADTMTGRKGDDRFYVDHAGDVVVEAAGEGSDRVFAATSYTLSAGAAVEMLTTIDNLATTAINLTGNALSQYVYGNAGANRLDGGGGGDTLVGLQGDDSYFVGHGSDRAVEYAGGGFDRVYAATSFTLEGGSEIEIITTNDNLGSAAISLRGNELGQYLFGNAGANLLDGKGGGDVLIGMGGADTFAFTTALAPGNVDRINDLQGGIDKIALDDAVFTGLGLGALSAAAFRAGSAALDADDRILYDAASGALYFDADGNGAAAAILFATVTPGTVLGASDFTVI